MKSLPFDVLIKSHVCTVFNVIDCSGKQAGGI